MALTIKMLRDENKQHFIPYTTTATVTNSATNENLQDILDNKLEVSNIKAGDGVSIETEGNDVTISCTGGGEDGPGYTLPVATDTILGGVKIGEGLEVTEDGTISVSVEGETFTEVDPVFAASAAATITEEDIDNWNAKPDNPGITSESDPIFTTSPAFNITQNDIDVWNSKPSKDEVSGSIGDALAGYITEETDPIFIKSAAYGITAGDITNWNSKADVTGILVETDPVFKASPAYNITQEKINEWDAKPNETGIKIEADPIFKASPAGAITQDDINNWNAKANMSDIPTDLGDLKNDKEGFISTETDPLFAASVASDITQTDIDNWNAKASLNDIPDSIKDFADAGDYVTTEGLTTTLNNTDISTFNNDAGYYNELWQIKNSHQSALDIGIYDDIPQNTDGYAYMSQDPLCLADIVRILQRANIRGEKLYEDPYYPDDTEMYSAIEWFSYDIREIFNNVDYEVEIGGGILHFRFGTIEAPTHYVDSTWKQMTYADLKEAFADNRIICKDLAMEEIYVSNSVGYNFNSNGGQSYPAPRWWFYDQHRVYMDLGGYQLPILLIYDAQAKKMSVNIEFFPEYIPDDFELQCLMIEVSEAVPFTMVSHYNDVHVYQPVTVVNFSTTTE